jgi:hypothetical protein
MRTTTRGMDASAGRNLPQNFSRTDHMLSPDSLLDGTPAGCLPKNMTREERNLGVRSVYATGTSQQALSDVTGLDPSSIFKICKGVVRESGRLPKGPEREARDEWIRKAAETEPVKAISDRAKISIFRVYQICKGLERIDLVRKARDERIRAALDRREKPKDIARNESTCVSNVYKIGSARG